MYYVEHLKSSGSQRIFKKDRIIIDNLFFSSYTNYSFSNKLKMVIIMTKNFLKSSVSAFVLLATLAAFPSQAMEEGEKEKAPSAQRKIPEDLLKILTPLEERHLQQTVLNSEQEQDDPSNPSMFPTELTKMFIGSIDTPSLLSTQAVSKLWFALSLEERKRRLEQWKPGDESQHLIRPFMTHPPYITNPCNLLWVHNVLSSKALLYSSKLKKSYVRQMFPLDFNFGLQTVSTAEGSVPEIIREYASGVKASPRLRPFFCRMFMNIDVLNMPSTALAAYVINQVPEMPAVFQKIVKELGFEPSEFSNLVKNPNNHLRLIPNQNENWVLRRSKLSVTRL
jgi:hypothetical protein